MAPFSGNPVVVLFGCVFALLLGASLAGLLLRRGRAVGALHDYFQRLKAWWWVAAFMLLVVLAGRWVGSLLFLLIILLALRECWRALRPQHPALPITALAVIVLGLSHLLLWLAEGESSSLLQFCWLILLTQLNDIAQYFAGKALGRHKLAPRLSPNKTWEGFAGGLLFTATSSALLTPLLLPLSLAQSLVFGLLAGSTGLLGDLAFSALKRRAGIKDFGSLLPGQGGILDRLDSLTFTAPVCFHFIRLVLS